MVIDLKKIGAAAGLIVALGAAGATLDEWRPWAKASDFTVIAGVSLKTAIAQRYDFLILERRELAQCQQAGGNCTHIERRIHDLEQEIKDLEAKQAKYGG